MLAFSNDYYGIIFRATQSVELFCAYQLIIQLQTHIGELSAKLQLYEEQKNSKDVKWDKESYNYLAIGNSITVHGFASYWWDDDRGMAASYDDSDYVHLVKNYLENKKGTVTWHVTNFSTFEAQISDREEFLPLLDPYLSDEIDLITIQLGENVNDITTWGIDFENLLKYVKKKASNAKVIVIGDFWSKGNRDDQKQHATIAQNVTYVSLDGIKDNKEYYAGMGTLVEDSEGNMKEINHEGVAIHPGDKGMRAIADRIIEVINSMN